MAASYRAAWSRIAVVILVAANIAAAYRLHESRWRSTPQDRVLAALAFADAVDGRRVVVPSDRPTLVAFVDRGSDTALAAMRELGSAEWTLTTIVVTPDPVSLITESQGVQDSSQIVAMDRDAVWRHLGLPKFWDRWLLYDSRGVLRAKGDFVNGGLVGAVAAVVDGLPEFSPEFVVNWLRQRDQQGAFVTQRAAAATASARQHEVLFVRRVASGCPISHVLRRMVVAAATRRDVVFSLMVPADWSSDQLRALKTNFDLTLQVEKADEKTTAEWRELAHLHGVNSTTGFLVQFSPEGIRRVEANAVRILDTFGDQRK